MTILSKLGQTNTIWHMAFTCPDIDAAIEYYCDVLGCKFCRKFVITVEDGSYNPGFIFSFAGHHIVVTQGETSIPQPDNRMPRHSGPIFLDKNEYFEVVDYVKSHPKINVIDSKYTTFIPKKLSSEEKYLHGQNVRCHKTTIKDPWDNWIEMKYYSYADQIYA